MDVYKRNIVRRSPKLIARFALCASLLASSGLSNASEVDTVYSFSTYDGALGRIVEDLDYPLATYFVVNGGSPVQRDPTTPYAIGPAAGDTRAGTGTVNLNAGITPPATLVEFYFGVFGDSTGFGFIHNMLSFRPGSATVNAGDIFRIATLNVQNGSWPVGDGTQNVPARIGFTIKTLSSDPALNNHVWQDTLIYTNRSVDGGSVADNADLFSFLNNPQMGAFSVNDGGSGSIDIMGKIGSLIPLFLANPTGDAFLPAGPAPAPAPAPATIALLGLGLAGLGFSRRKCANFSVLSVVS